MTVYRLDLMDTPRTGKRLDPSNASSNYFAQLVMNSFDTCKMTGHITTWALSATLENWIPSISESILNTTPRMLTSTYEPSLYYPYKMVVRKLNLSAVRNTRFFKCQRAGCGINIRNRESPLRLRDYHLSSCAVYRRSLSAVCISFLIPISYTQ
jgi:hypothetical protein